MKTLAVLLISFGSFGVRWLRWLGFVQQKEYRWDRLKLFLSSPEGRLELKCLLPRRADFSRTGLKRPKITSRIAVVALISLGLIAADVYVLFLLTQSLSLTNKIVALVIWLVMTYLLLPLFVLISMVPTGLIKWLATWYYLRKAKAKFELHNPVVIGITGSFGKTSTKQLLAHLLGGESDVYATPDSYNEKLSVARSICRDYRGQKITIIEYGAYADKEIAQLAGWIKPDVAIITGVAPQHLGLFGDLEAIIKAKSELVTALPDDGTVYFNSSQPEVKQLVELGVGERKIKQMPFTGRGSELVKMTSAGVTDQGFLECLVGDEIIRTKLVGEHYLLALVGAVTVALDHKHAPDKVWQRVSTFQPGSNFVQIKHMTDGNLMIDDGGTSNPAGFESAVMLADRMPARQKILVTPGIIDLGKESRSVHKQLAIQAKTVFNQVYYLDTPGKDEFMSQLGHNLVSNKQEIKKKLLQLEAGTLVLIEGRVPSWLLPTVNKLTRQIA